MLVIDPKGEHAAFELAHGYRRAMGQKIVVLDPFGEVGGADRFNPFAGVNVADDRAVLEWLNVMEAALITHESGENSHWSNGAASCLRFFLLWMLATPERGGASFARLFDLLNEGEGGTDRDNPENIFIQAIEHAETTKNKRLKMAGSGLANRQGLPSFMSSLFNQLRFIEDLALTQDGASSFDFSELKRSKITVYVVISGSKIATHFRWLRLLLMLANAAMEKGERPAQDVVFLLEEFAALGRLEVIEKAAGLMRGYGLKLWVILQDLTQLQEHYRQTWETFLDNAGAIQAFGNAGGTTSEYLSKRLGQKLYRVQESAHLGSQGLAGAASPVTERREWMPLLPPSQVPLTFPRWENVNTENGTRQALPLLLIIKEKSPAKIERLPFDWKK
mgnify:CR=1 FL=1